MELEMKRGLELLEMRQRLTSAGPNPIEQSPATTGLMNFRWKLPLGPVGIRVHLMVFSGKPGESYSNSPNTYHAVFFCYFRNQNCTAKNSYICEKNKNSQYVTSTPAPGSTTEGTQTTTTPAPPTASCNCGLVNRQSRIVGGVETSVNKYPWMV